MSIRHIGSKPRNFRELHGFHESPWYYRIHKDLVEIRSPDDKKYIVGFHEINKSKEFKERFEIVDEYCYCFEISHDEFTRYKDKEDGKYYNSADSNFMNEWFGIWPSRIKEYIKENLL